MNLEIVTPDKKIFEGEADGVQLPGTDGSFEILSNHAPYITTLGTGKLRIKVGKESTIYQISGGVVEALNNKVIVLAESITE
ncbi:MAG: ATP synthase F1 subunit epsilon [Bacteroidota bacterium]|nr:ATP synthase F1 subunit epsilon [Bacteroidota bacterium]